MLKKALLLGLLGCASGAGAVSLDDTRVLHLSVSNYGINRICVEGDRITNVLVNPVWIQNDIHLDESGHLFVLGNENTKEAFVSIVTEMGQIQDLKLSFSKRDAVPVHLKGAEKKVSSPTLGPQEISGLMRRFMAGDAGSFRLTDLDTFSRVRDDFVAKPEASYLSPCGRYVLARYSVRGKGATLPAPSLFKEQGDLALMFNEKALTPTSRLFVLLERRRSS